LKSREYGIGKGGCFVSFKNETPVQNIAMVRVLLTSTYWPEHDETRKDISSHVIGQETKNLQVTPNS